MRGFQILAFGFPVADAISRDRDRGTIPRVRVLSWNWKLNDAAEFTLAAGV